MTDGVALKIGTLNYETVACYSCGMVFAVPYRWQENRRDDKKEFYCPNGHGQSYTGESAGDKAKRLQRELTRERTQHIEEVDNIRRAHKGAMTKLKKRAIAGVCPCCNRTFKQLARHMKAKHPDYGKPK